MAVLEVIEQEQMISHVVSVGNKLVRYLRDLAQRRRYIGQITGKGFMVGIDLVEDKKTRKPAKELATWVIAKMKVILNVDLVHCMHHPPPVMACFHILLLFHSSCDTAQTNSSNI